MRPFLVARPNTKRSITAALRLFAPACLCAALLTLRPIAAVADPGYDTYDINGTLASGATVSGYADFDTSTDTLGDFNLLVSTSPYDPAFDYNSASNNISGGGGGGTGASAYSYFYAFDSGLTRDIFIDIPQSGVTNALNGDQEYEVSDINGNPTYDFDYVSSGTITNTDATPAPETSSFMSFALLLASGIPIFLITRKKASLRV